MQTSKLPTAPFGLSSTCRTQIWYAHYKHSLLALLLILAFCFVSCEKPPPQFTTQRSKIDSVPRETFFEVDTFDYDTIIIIIN